MKKVIFGLLSGAILLFSCSKEDATPVTTQQLEVDAASVPSSILAYINENYPDAGIDMALKYSSGDTAFLITLTTSEFLVFDRNGNRMGQGNPGLIGDSSLIIGDSLGHHGGGHHGGGHHGGGHHGGGISPDSIPADIALYIETNFPGFTVHHARYDTLCQFGAVLEVMTDSVHLRRLKLLFDGSNNYVAQADRMASDSLPELITSSLASNFAGFTLRRMAEVFMLADGSLQYQVFLHSTTTRMRLVLAADGTVVCEQ